MEEKGNALPLKQQKRTELLNNAESVDNGIKC